MYAYSVIFMAGWLAGCLHMSLCLYVHVHACLRLRLCFFSYSLILQGRQLGVSMLVRWLLYGDSCLPRDFCTWGNGMKGVR